MAVCFEFEKCNKSHALEVNPWFRYYVMRDGKRAALKEALHFSVGRWTMTHPNGECGKCGDPMWFRPIVGSYLCFTCSDVGAGLVASINRALQ